MDVPKVLVAYASDHGGTAGIANAVGDAIREAGLQTDVKPVADVSSLDGYDAVILGSAVYMLRWRHAAKRFGRKFAAALRDRQVWLFSSGPLDNSAEERELTPPRAAAKISARVHARGHTWFGGVLDPDAGGMAGTMARNLVTEGKALDYRDFDHVNVWSRAIAAELLGSSVGRAP